MLSETVYVPASPDIVFEEFDGDLVALDLSTGRYFGFNGTARLLWNALIAGASQAEVARRVEFNGKINAKTLSGFVDQLVTFELLVRDDDRASSPMDPEVAADLEAQDAAPAVETYDDLADLIVADPIHDADESAGWPHVRPAARR